MENVCAALVDDGRACGFIEEAATSARNNVPMASAQARKELLLRHYTWEKGRFITVICRGSSLSF